MSINLNKLPEILAPVGDLAMCRAAVHSGADAIYVGMPNFNARGRAVTLSLEELKEIIDFCHLYGVKVYIACNVLIFEQELEMISDSLKEVIALRPDAFIVQDIGLCRLIRKIAPNMRIHASTQMTVSCLEAIQATENLNLQRYVLAREVSLGELSRIIPNTDKEIEMFVHGALCVSYSGQCLTSESFGGRSANRGQCAQACRLDYKLIVDDLVKDTGDLKYFVSPKDFCGLNDIPRLMELGVDSFKIEGRLKSPQYVASTVSAYKSMSLGALSPSQAEFEVSKMEKVYSRGFFNGWLDGVNHQMLVDGRYSSHQGPEIGQVYQKIGKFIEIKTSEQLSPGDGLLFADFSQNLRIGIKVFSARRISSDVISVYAGDDYDTSAVRNGMTVFLNTNPSLLRSIEQGYVNKDNFRRIPVKVFVQANLTDGLSCEIKDPENRQVSLKSKTQIQPAKKIAASVTDIEAEFNKLSGSAFEIKSIKTELADNIFINAKDLKELRQEAFKTLESLRINAVTIEFNPEFTYQQPETPTLTIASKPELNVLVRDFSQLEDLADLDISKVTLDFEFGKEYGPALEKVRMLGYPCEIATTRILKTGELGHLKQIERLKPDSVLLRNLGALHFFENKGLKLCGDFSFNVANSFTAEWFLAKGLSTFCPSYDLNSEQLKALLANTDSSKAEITIHQYMPSFHMEHCVFAGFLSDGTTYRDCGRPCEKHRVELMDNKGQRHPLKADAECRNTMFHGVPQSAAKLIPDLRNLGVRIFRLEALFESAAELRGKVMAYRNLLDQKISAAELYNSLNINERYGISEGQLLNIQTYKDRKKVSPAV